MKRSYALSVTVIMLVLLSSASGAIAQGPTPFQPSLPQAGAGPQTALGTAFTYQGQLKKDGAPVNDTCDFSFFLFDAAAGGNQIAPPLLPLKQTLAVVNGLFTTQIDLGTNVFNGEARWLDVSVRCPSGSGSYTALTPRQPLTPAPYALALPGLYTQQNTNSPNIIGGYSGNSTNSGVLGATISGGGASTYINRVADNFGTVGGGRGNQAGDNAGTTVDKTDATVGGGYNNTASGSLATVGGGYGNTAGGDLSIVPGGVSNIAMGYSSFAAGRRAKANYDGSFVWGDSTDADFASTAANQFLIRASNGVGINTTSTTANNLTVNGQIIGGGTGAPSGYEPFVALGPNSGISMNDRAGGTNPRWVVYPNLGSLQFWNGANRVTINSSGNVGIGTTNPTAKLDVAGTMASNVVQIRGGSDLAEKFDVSSETPIEPGTLMVIDERNPGRLKPSDQAYDTKVAGIVSGAGGVQPGLTLQQEGVMEGNTAVAIAGRVYVKAEAFSAPIRPGDLLTSSSIPGYVMKATDRVRGQGAIIGKAMSELKDGMGLVLVLVNLQ